MGRQRAVLWYLEEIIIQCFYYLRFQTKTLHCRHFSSGAETDRNEWLVSTDSCGELVGIKICLDWTHG